MNRRMFFGTLAATAIGTRLTLKLPPVGAIPGAWYGLDPAKASDYTAFVLRDVSRDLHITFRTDGAQARAVLADAIERLKALA